MDKELAKQLKEVEKINQDSKKIRQITDDITKLMQNMEV